MDNFIQFWEFMLIVKDNFGDLSSVKLSIVQEYFSAVGLNDFVEDFTSRSLQIFYDLVCVNEDGSLTDK